MERVLNSGEKMAFVVQVFESNAKHVLQKTPRWLCLIVGRKDPDGKAAAKLARVKVDASGEYSVTKSWPLEEIKRIDGRMLPEYPSSFAIAVEKNLYEFTCESAKHRAEFLWNFLAVCRSHLSKLPTLKNIHEQKLEDILGIGEAVHAEPTTSSSAQAHGTGRKSSDTSNVPLSFSQLEWEVADAAALESRLYDELNGLDAANVFALVQCDDELTQIVHQVDDALAQLNVMDNWFDQYSVQLQRMHDDIMQIENANNTTQMLAVNERTLLESLEKLIESITLSEATLRTLESTPLQTASEVADATEAAWELERILLKNQDASEFEEMSAVEEKITFFKKLRRDFSIRLEDRLYVLIEALVETCNKKSRLSKRGDLRLYDHRFVHDQLLLFKDLTKWLQVMDPRKLGSLGDYYVQQFHKIYKREVKMFMEELRQHHLSKPTSEEIESFAFSGPVSSFHQPNLRPARVSQMFSSSVSLSQLKDRASAAATTTDASSSSTGFRSQEFTKSDTAISSSGKGSAIAESKSSLVLSVSQEVATPSTPAPRASNLTRHARQLSFALGVSGMMGKKGSSIGVSQLHLDGSSETVTRLELSSDKLPPEEAIGQVLRMIYPIFCSEDLFLLGCFHGVQSDATESVVAADSEAAENDFDSISISEVSNLSAGAEVAEPIDASEVRAVLSEAEKTSNSRVTTLFDFLYKELLQLCESVVKSNASAAIHLIELFAEFKREQAQKQSPYFVILDMIESNKLRVCFEKFVDDQVRAILETKIVAQKRPGVLSHVKKLPNFIERMERLTRGNFSPASKELVDRAYGRLSAALFELLSVIAQTADPDAEKDLINVHVIYIENCHHFWSQVARFKVGSFEQPIKEAKKLYERHLTAYVDTIIKRPMGKLYDFFEGIDALLLTRRDEEVSYQLAFNKAALKKCVGQFSGSVVKKALELLYHRVNKHFGEEEGLRPVVWRSVQEELIRRHAHFTSLIDRCYPGSGVVLGFAVEDLLTDYSESGSSTAAANTTSTTTTTLGRRSGDSTSSSHT